MELTRKKPSRVAVPPRPPNIPTPGFAVNTIEPNGQPPSKRPGVLVVDDDHLVRIMVQLALERNGFDVWLAANGSEALDRYQQFAGLIDVVLLDVRMPVLDGPAALDRLRELNPDVRVCFMSGDTGTFSIEDLVRRGASSVIAKPFRLDQLANNLRLLAQGMPPDRSSVDGECNGHRRPSTH